MILVKTIGQVGKQWKSHGLRMKGKVKLVQVTCDLLYVLGICGIYSAKYDIVDFISHDECEQFVDRLFETESI